jgi:tRNA-specific 2-thiouridylase
LIRCQQPVWIARQPDADFECQVQLRAHGMVSAARIRLAADGGLSAVLHQSQRGVAAGQALVMYDGDRVLGSATIGTAERSVVPA